MNPMQKLAANLNGAQYVRYFDEMNIITAWFGGYGVSVFDATTGREVDVFHPFDMSEPRESITIDAVDQAMKEYLQYLLEEEG